MANSNRRPQCRHFRGGDDPNRSGGGKASGSRGLTNDDPATAPDAARESPETAVMSAKYFILTAIRVLTLDAEGVPSVDTVEVGSDRFRAIVGALGKTAREALGNGKPQVVGRQPDADSVSVSQVLAFGYDPATHSPLPEGATLYPVGETMTGHRARTVWQGRDVDIMDVLGWQPAAK